ncbi:MAG TPA: Imm52 family immunity protein [Stellaceae bacterium]|nr:Imm52 family immunity protein [Stellaceae bacterium]
MSEFLGYLIQAYWGPRRETPAHLGQRFWKMLQTLSAVNPAFNGWKFIGTDTFWPLPSGPGNDLTRLIANGVATADDGDPTPIYGYHFGASARAGSKTSVTLVIQAGFYAPNPPYFANTAELQTQPINEHNAALVTLAIFKAALVAIAEAWDATWCAAYPSDIISLWPNRIAVGRPMFKMAWITYLSPRSAPMVTPPASAIVEHTAQGGIVMAATEDRFDVTNPAHLAVAREIEAAIAPVNALPWPPDATPG